MPQADTQTSGKKRTLLDADIIGSASDLDDAGTGEPGPQAESGYSSASTSAKEKTWARQKEQ
jgi:hypothetical protein